MAQEQIASYKDNTFFFDFDKLEHNNKIDFDSPVKNFQNNETIFGLMYSDGQDILNGGQLFSAEDDLSTLNDPDRNSGIIINYKVDGIIELENISVKIDGKEENYNLSEVGKESQLGNLAVASLIVEKTQEKGSLLTGQELEEELDLKLQQRLESAIQRNPELLEALHRLDIEQDDVRQAQGTLAKEKEDVLEAKDDAQEILDDLTNNSGLKIEDLNAYKQSAGSKFEEVERTSTNPDSPAFFDR